MNRKIFNRAMPASSFLTHLMDGNAVDAGKVSTATSFIGTDATKLQDKIHGVAVACIYLSMSVAEGGPATGAAPALRLLNVLPKGQRAKDLAAWFAKFSNIRVRFDPKAKAWTGGVIDAKTKLYAVPRPNEAMDCPFWELAKDDRIGADFTTDKLASRVKAIITAAKADTAKLDAKGKAALADLESLAAKLEPAQ